jgi:hypothetical protein
MRSPEKRVRQIRGLGREGSEWGCGAWRERRGGGEVGRVGKWGMGAGKWDEWEKGVGWEGEASEGGNVNKIMGDHGDRSSDLLTYC